VTRETPCLAGVFDRLASARPGILLASILAVFLAPMVILGKYSALPIGDNAEIILAGLISLAEQGGPGWFVNSAAGFPTDALGYASWLNVTLFRLMPAWLAVLSLIVVQLSAACLGSYGLARRAFAVDKVPALFAAAVYGLLATGRIIDITQAGLPLVLLAVGWLAAKPQQILRWPVVLTAVAAYAQAGYFSFVVPWPAVALTAWFLMVERVRGWKSWAAIVASAVAVVAVRFPEALAIRTAAAASQIHLLRGLPDLATLPRTPDFFATPISVVCLALLLIGVAGSWRTNRAILGALVLVALVEIGIQAALAVQALLGDMIPMLRGYNVTRVGMAGEPALFLGATTGVQTLWAVVRNGDRGGWGAGRRLAAFGLAGIVLVWSAAVAQRYVFLGKEWLTQGSFTANFESALFRDLGRRAAHDPWPSRAEAVGFYPGFLQAHGLETAGGYHALYGLGYYQLWSTIVEPWMLSAADESERWWLKSPALMAQTDNWPMYRGERLMLTPHDHVAERRLTDYYRLNLLSLANVRYLVTKDRLTDAGLIELQAPQDGPWNALGSASKAWRNVKANFLGRSAFYIYENPAAFPRFFSPVGIRVFADHRQLLAGMAAADTGTLRRVLHTAQTDLPQGLGAETPLAPVTIHPEAYGPEEIRLSVEAAAPGLLVGVNGLSDRWRCDIDGVPAPIFPAYRAFWGVLVPAGAQSVVFRFR
jgi:hypothetical protein